MHINKSHTLQHFQGLSCGQVSFNIRNVIAIPTLYMYM